MKTNLSLFVLIALLILLLSPPAFAQQRTNVVAVDCAGISLRSGTASFTYVDQTGKQCVTSTSNGSTESTLMDVLAELQDILTKLNATIAVTVPADPFGTNADAAASAGGTGSNSAKTRRISADMDRAAAALETIRDSTAAVPVYTDPCNNPTVTRVPFNKNFASTTSQELVPATSSKTGYICDILVVTNAAEIVSLIDGTQSSSPCDAGTPTALAGSTTAANGLSFGANGGYAKGNGQGWIYKTSNTNRQICAITSGSGRTTVSGTYVIP